MACSRLLKLKHVHYICIFFILYLIFYICGKSQTERTNKSKKSPSHIYSLLLIWFECISLALLGLPCYHHEMQVILLNSILSFSIKMNIIDICFQSFFVREFYKGHSQHWQLAKDHMVICDHQIVYKKISKHLGSECNKFRVKRKLVYQKGKKTLIRNSFSLELL